MSEKEWKDYRVTIAVEKTIRATSKEGAKAKARRISHGNFEDNAGMKDFDLVGEFVELVEE